MANPQYTGDPVLAAALRKQHLQSIMGRTNPKRSTPITADEVMTGEEMLLLYESMLEIGGAVLFGRTSDGGSITITYYIDKAKQTEFIADRAAWADLLQRLCGTVGTPDLGGEEVKTT